MDEYDDGSMQDDSDYAPSTDMDEEAVEDDSEAFQSTSARELISFLLRGGSLRPRARARVDLKSLPKPAPVAGPLRQELLANTCVASGSPAPLPCLGVGSSRVAYGVPSPAAAEQEQASSSSSDGSSTTDNSLKVEIRNSWSMLANREMGLYATDGFSLPARRHLLCHRNLPKNPVRIVDTSDHNAYIGQFSANGDLFYAALKDKRIRVYDVQNNWTLKKDIEARHCRWTITDASLSPDQRFLLYSSINPVVRLVNIGSSLDIIHSISNITEVHEELSFDTDADSFGIWSVQWSGDGSQVVAGTGDNSVMVYGVESDRVVAKASNAHTDDVNAVRYMDDTGNVIVSGSDDSSLKVWDRRLLDCTRRARPVGLLLGHLAGVTYIDPKGDGFYCISNGKDQTAKLWDIRKVLPSTRRVTACSTLRNFDYRWQPFPCDAHALKHEHDVSVMTYRGHSVLRTLIRAHFSPAFTTGQRFVYSGSSDGKIRIWDVLTGDLLEDDMLCYHNGIVRDCSWHPYQPALASVGWDGTLISWDVCPGATKLPPAPAVRDYY